MKVLIRGGYLNPTAERANNIPEADILIEDYTITEVREPIDPAVDHICDSGARAVIPGLIDLHRLTWETVLSNSVSDATWPSCQERRHTLRRAFTPDDVYASTLLGAASAVHPGSTTGRRPRRPVHVARTDRRRSLGLAARSGSHRPRRRWGR
ncbi:hypothetical protein [Nocardia sp. NPDC004123]